MNKEQLLDIVASSHGIDKTTNEIKDCHLLKCSECKFGKKHCYEEMLNWLHDNIESEDKNE